MNETVHVEMNSCLLTIKSCLLTNINKQCLVITIDLFEIVDCLELLSSLAIYLMNLSHNRYSISSITKIV
jgi:hypothetical protein